MARAKKRGLSQSGTSKSESPAKRTRVADAQPVTKAVSVTTTVSNSQNINPVSEKPVRTSSDKGKQQSSFMDIDRDSLIKTSQDAEELYVPIPDLTILQAQLPNVITTALRITPNAKLRAKIATVLQSLTGADTKGETQQGDEAGHHQSTKAETRDGKAQSNVTQVQSTHPRLVVLQAKGNSSAACRLVSIAEIAKRHLLGNRNTGINSAKVSNIQPDNSETGGQEGAQSRCYQYTRLDSLLEAWHGESAKEKRRRRLVNLAERSVTEHKSEPEGKTESELESMGKKPVNCGRQQAQNTVNVSTRSQQRNSDDNGLQGGSDPATDNDGNEDGGGGGDTPHGDANNEDMTEDDGENAADSSFFFERMGTAKATATAMGMQGKDDGGDQNSTVLGNGNSGGGNSSKVRAVAVLTVILSTVRLPELRTSFTEKVDAG